MHRPTMLIGMLCAFGLASFAAAPIATVSSSQSFALDGHAITTAGVTSWPLVLGDQVTTSSVPALVSFPDGSRIQLAPRSEARIIGTTENPKVVLIAGNLQYKLAPGSALSLTNSGGGGTPSPSPVPSPSPQATVNVQSNHLFWIEGLLFAISITALIIAIYDLKNLPSVSSH